MLEGAQCRCSRGASAQADAETQSDAERHLSCGSGTQPSARVPVAGCPSDRGPAHTRARQKVHGSRPGSTVLTHSGRCAPDGQVCSGGRSVSNPLTWAPRWRPAAPRLPCPVSGHPWSSGPYFQSASASDTEGLAPAACCGCRVGESPPGPRADRPPLS